MTLASLQPTLLVPAGRTLLLGAFAVTLIQTMRGKLEPALAFERLVIGMLALTYFRSGADTLETLSDLLTAMISDLGNRDDLRAFILGALKKAAATPTGDHTGLNIPAAIEQAWRTGVWGIMTALVEGVFLIVAFVLECSREVFWMLLLFLFPLSCGVFPIFPRMMTNLVIYSVELSLWLPMLCLVELTTGIVARKHLVQDGGWGLYIVAIQSIAILLIILIPTVTHRFLSGAFSGDFNSQSGLFVLVKKVVRVTNPIRASGGAS